MTVWRKGWINSELAVKTQVKVRKKKGLVGQNFSFSLSLSFTFVGNILVL